MRCLSSNKKNQQCVRSWPHSAQPHVAKDPDGGRYYWSVTVEEKIAAEEWLSNQMGKYPYRFRDEIPVSGFPEIQPVGEYL